MKFLLRLFLTFIGTVFSASFALALAFTDIPTGGQFVGEAIVMKSDRSAITLCSDTKRNKKVIIKSVPKAIQEDFENEIAMMFTHTNILPRSIKLIDIVVEGDSTFAVLEYANGGDCFTLIENSLENKTYIKDARVIFLSAMQALAELHKKNIAHMDVKPENFFVFEDEAGKLTIKIGDFGMSEYFPPKVRHLSKRRNGTGKYMAPEVFMIDKSAKDNDPYHPFASDIYSAGIMLFELLTNKSLYNFPCATDKNFVFLNKKGLNKWLKRYGMQHLVKPGAISLIEKMINLDPRKRPTIQQVLDDTWLSGSSERKDID